MLFVCLPWLLHFAQTPLARRASQTRNGPTTLMPSLTALTTWKTPCGSGIEATACDLTPWPRCGSFSQKPAFLRLKIHLTCSISRSRIGRVFFGTASYSMPLPLPLHEAAQHRVHTALPAAPGALVKLEHIGVEAHGDLTLVLLRALHKPGRRLGTARPVAGNPFPCEVACHIGGQFLLGFGGDLGPIGSVLAARFHRGQLLSRIPDDIALFPHLSPSALK